MNLSVQDTDYIAPFDLISRRHTDVECIVHFHGHLEAVLVTEGTLFMRISDREYEISSGYGVFIAPFEPHLFQSREANKCHIIMFSEETAGSFFEYISQCSVDSHIFPFSPETLALTNRILPYQDNAANAIEASAVISPLCYDIWQSCHFREHDSRFNDIVTSSLQYVDQHFREPLSLKQVAGKMGVHPITLSKSLSAGIGVGFNYYLRYRRCSHAAHLMKSTDLTFTAISYEAGFGSIRSFNRSFAQIYGQTPTRYRNSFSSTPVYTK